MKEGKLMAKPLRKLYRPPVLQKRDLLTVVAAALPTAKDS
jgi:hypothetical protein